MKEKNNKEPRNRHGDPGVQGREMEGAGGGGCDECVMYHEGITRLAFSCRFYMLSRIPGPHARLELATLF